MMQVSYTLYIIQLSTGGSTTYSKTGCNINSYTNHVTTLNMCSVYLSHCSYSNELLCDAILGMNLHLSE